MSAAIENERLKSQANYLQNLSVAMIATGVLAPIAGMVFSSNPDAIQKPLVMLIMIAYSFSGWFLLRKSGNLLRNMVE